MDLGQLAIEAVPALFPAISGGIRAVFNRVTHGAGAAPANVQEAIQLMDADTNRLKVLADLDKAEGVSQWVADIRAMQRPVAVGVILVTYAGCVAFGAPAAVVTSVGEYARMVTFYLFGDRTYTKFRK